ncbi:MAG: glutamyl-tRNA reductase [Candidatus Omnitrophota bacterium]|nr:glutamyl-tRNA reductase [Candidatus Omnitrophota bacterium]
MKQIYVIGINHKTAPLEVREKFYLSEPQQDLLLSELKSFPAVLEAFVISTCNRTEIYVNLLETFDPVVCLLPVLCALKKIPQDVDLAKIFYVHKDQAAVRHLLEVVSGLDSLVLGEKQILGQVKLAIDRARQQNILHTKFNILSNIAIRAGKKVQTETAIGWGGSSVSWAAIVKAEEILGTLTDKTILMMGAGKMSDLAVGQIQNKNFKKLYMMNRTEANACALAEKYGGEAVSFYDLKDILQRIDLCICSTSAPHYILEKSIVAKIMPQRESNPLILIDISMPRNIDPQVATVPGVLLFYVDDLQAVVDSTMKIRHHAIPSVEKIIAQKLSEYQSKIQQPQSQFYSGIES